MTISMKANDTQTIRELQARVKELETEHGYDVALAYLCGRMALRPPRIDLATGFLEALGPLEPEGGPWWHGNVYEALRVLRGEQAE